MSPVGDRKSSSGSDSYQRSSNNAEGSSSSDNDIHGKGDKKHQRTTFDSMASKVAANPRDADLNQPISENSRRRSKPLVPPTQIIYMNAVDKEIGKDGMPFWPSEQKISTKSPDSDILKSGLHLDKNTKKNLTPSKIGKEKHTSKAKDTEIDLYQNKKSESIDVSNENILKGLNLDMKKNPIAANKSVAQQENAGKIVQDSKDKSCEKSETNSPNSSDKLNSTLNKAVSNLKKLDMTVVLPGKETNHYTSESPLNPKVIQLQATENLDSSVDSKRTMENPTKSHSHTESIIDHEPSNFFNNSPSRARLQRMSLVELQEVCNLMKIPNQGYKKALIERILSRNEFGKATSGHSDKSLVTQHANAYLLFSKFTRSELLAKHPQMNFVQLGETISSQWKDLSEKEKQVWMEKNHEIQTSQTDGQEKFAKNSKAEVFEDQKQVNSGSLSLHDNDSDSDDIPISQLVAGKRTAPKIDQAESWDFDSSGANTKKNEPGTSGTKQVKDSGANKRISIVKSGAAKTKKPLEMSSVKGFENFQADISSKLQDLDVIPKVREALIQNAWKSRCLSKNFTQNQNTQGSIKISDGDELSAEQEMSKKHKLFDSSDQSTGRPQASKSTMMISSKEFKTASGEGSNSATKSARKKISEFDEFSVKSTPSNHTPKNKSHSDIDFKEVQAAMKSNDGTFLRKKLLEAGIANLGAHRMEESWNGLTRSYNNFSRSFNLYSGLKPCPVCKKHRNGVVYCRLKKKHTELMEGDDGIELDNFYSLF